MARNIDELRKQILEKNQMLNSIGHGDNSANEKVIQVKNELDRLLYHYLKSIKNGSDSRMLISEG